MSVFFSHTCAGVRIPMNIINGCRVHRVAQKKRVSMHEQRGSKVLEMCNRECVMEVVVATSH